MTVTWSHEQSHDIIWSMSSHMTSHEQSHDSHMSSHMTVTWWLRIPLFIYSPMTSVRERFSCAMFVTFTFTVNRLFHLPKLMRKDNGFHSVN